MMSAHEGQTPGRIPATVLENEAGFADESDLLFAYGTLGPSDLEEEARAGWVADAVRGRLFDLGPYPALVELDGPGARWVEGFVRPITRDELIQSLDPYEGVSQGQYHRVVATTRVGLRVWIYVYARPLPVHARELLTRWTAAAGPAAEGREANR